jgi:ribosomal protein S12
MTQVIIYSNGQGGICVVTPTPEALETMAIEEIAVKDVPHGIKYKIIDASELPQDRTFRSAWEMQE